MASKVAGPKLAASQVFAKKQASLKSNERQAGVLLATLRTCPLGDGGMKQPSTTYAVKHRKLSRASVEGPGLQGLARRVLHVVGGHLDDWDIVN